jgi:FAD/FMN-containing dehydrogenase
MTRPSVDASATPLAFGGAGLGAAVLRPGDAEYDGARRVWNGMIDRRPAAIVRCRDAGEVRATIAAARAQGLPIAVRGGGHNAAGLSVCEGGVVIDLSPMRGVWVDPAARTARVEGGARWADLDAAAQAHGLATTGGIVSTTGVGGLTLGGGIGWLMRRFGLACDNVLAFEVATADGRLVRATADEHPELYWGLRGGGGNFGVVTAFTFRLHPVGPTVVSGMLVHPLERAKDVLRFMRDVGADAPDALAIFAAIMTSPEGAKVVALLPTWTGPVDEAEDALRALRAFGPPLADTVGPMPYVAVQRMLDDAFPTGLHVYWRGEFASSLDDALIDALVDRFGEVTSPLTAVAIEQMGGAVARVPADATAFRNRDAGYNLALIGRWTDPAERDAHVRWVRDTHDAVRPFARESSYVNYIGAEEGADRVRGAYGEAAWARLVALKDAWDPENVFRFNQNVPPSR